MIQLLAGGVVLPALVLAAHRQQGQAVADKVAGLELVLPDATWRRTDAGSAGVVARIYSPATPPVPRVTLLRIPAVFLAEGFATRVAGLRRLALDEERLESCTFLGRKAQRFTYLTQQIRTVEYGLRDGEAWIVVQLAARAVDWKDPAKAKTYAAILGSVKLLPGGPAVRQLRVDRKTARAVHELRRRREPKPAGYAVRAHDLRLRIDPAQGSLGVRDDLDVEILRDGVAELVLVTTRVDVDRVGRDGVDLGFRKRGAAELVVDLGRPAAKGETIRLRFEAHAARFEAAQDQKLVAEVAVYGQVAATSSFSSHVVYYPIDRRNDAAVRIALSVPDGYTAVSGGAPGEATDEPGRTVFHYRSPIRTPRALPFGFAVARYDRVSARTDSGLVLDVYYPAGKEKEARQRLAVARASGTLFEDLMGPLPWRRVAFCWVKPSRKSVGVSLPGMILLSDDAFTDTEGLHLDGAKLDDPRTKGLLLVTDELSHQWNFYAAHLPNELAEGISTFTNLLYLEAVEGAEDYREGVAYCAKAYRAGAATTQDFALADPSLYRSGLYRLVAFCKVPAVLDLLRRRLGAERFAAAWRQAFVEMDHGRGSYASFAAGLSRASGRDLLPFFDRWFFQAGYPDLSLGWKNEVVAGKPLLSIEVGQDQPGGLYTLSLPLEARVAGAWRPAGILDVTARKTAVTKDVGGPVEDLRIRPGATSPLLRVRVRPR